MALIDDEGNLFGVVNVIDALAVLLVLAVAVAGIAVVGVLSGGGDSGGGDSGGGESATRYTTVDLGSQPAYVVSNVEVGDEMAIEGYDQKVTVTDVYATSDGGSSYLTARVALEGERIETDDGRQVFEFAGERLRVGDRLEIKTDDYAAAGNVTVTSLERNGTDLSVETTPALLESTVSTTTANAISEGDTFEVGPHTVATVTSVRSYPTDNDQRRVHIGVELETLRQGGSLTFADRPLTIGSEVPIRSDTYSINGELVRRGATEATGETGVSTFELKLENVDPDIANGLETGMTETERGETLATVQSVDTQPAKTVLESEDGNIYLREHPTNKDVRLAIKGQTVTAPSGVRFHGESLREGDTVTLDLGSMIVQGEVTRLNAVE